MVSLDIIFFLFPLLYFTTYNIYTVALVLHYVTENLQERDREREAEVDLKIFLNSKDV